MIPAVSRGQLDDGLVPPFAHDAATQPWARPNAGTSRTSSDGPVSYGAMDGLSAVRPNRSSDHDQFRQYRRLPTASGTLGTRGSGQLKISISRSSLLTALVIVALAVALPFAVVEFIKTGEFYILSHRFMEDMLARLHGPGRLRFIFQPVAAIVLGARDGVKDARVGKRPFLWGLVFGRGSRRDLIRSALASVRNLVAVAILLDMVAQLLIFRMVHPGAALLFGPVLIALPYAIARALTNRIAIWRSAPISITHAS